MVTFSKLQKLKLEEKFRRDSLIAEDELGLSDDHGGIMVWMKKSTKLESLLLNILA